MTKASATTAKKPATKKATTKKATAKKATAKTATTSRASTKARTPAKKTAATRATSAKGPAPKTAKATKTTKKTTAKATTKPSPKAAAAPKRKATAAKTVSEKKSVKSATKTAAAKSVPAKASKVVEKPTGEEDKPKIAPAPMRPALRVAKRAEARRDRNQTFKVKTQIVYPAHGVGFITSVETQTIADIEVELFVIDFEHEKMKLRVPVAKAASGAGMRNLSSVKQIEDALKMLEDKARVKRTMWSRRAQEYDAKINSGDLISVAEVVRDLFRADDQPEQSYSERQLFEQARERFGREVAAVRKKTLEDAIVEIHKHLDRKEKPNAPEAAASA